MAWVVAASMGIPILMLSIGLAAASPQFDIVDAVGIAFALSLFLVLGPALVVRKIVLGDIGATARLVRRGRAFRASIVRRTFVRGSIAQVILAWDEDGRRQGATFALTQKAVDADPDEIVIIARPYHSRVVAAFGSLGMSIGVRKRLWGKDRHQ